MARAPLNTLTQIADEVLREVDQAAFTKQAEREAVRAVAAEPKTEIGQLIHKVAEAVRQDANDAVTYEDLAQFLARGGRS